MERKKPQPPPTCLPPPVLAVGRPGVVLGLKGEAQPCPLHLWRKMRCQVS